MSATRINFDKKYLVDIENVDKNKVYVVTAIKLSMLKEKIDSLFVENCDTIQKSVNSALKSCYTDKYPFTNSKAKYIYDLEQQVRDENIISFKSKDSLKLRERFDF